MADGRELIEQAYQIITELASKGDSLVKDLADDQADEFKTEMDAAVKWVKLCRDKVWLRGKQGTDMAQEGLESANRLKAAIADPAAMVEAVADLSLRLETLARLIASKVQVLT